MLDTIRRWLGATRRERELRAKADGLWAECERLRHHLNLADIGRATTPDERDGLAERLKAAEAERDAARAESDRRAGELARRGLAAERYARATRGSLTVIAHRLRQFAIEIEPSSGPGGGVSAQPAEEATP